MKLEISRDLKLPLAAQTETLVVYGGKGMGKTNFGSVLVEELAKRGLRFSVIDPLDVWWGLQHGAKRGQPGIDVVILGGPHGDIPIEPTAGAVVADFVADEAVSTIIVLRKAGGEMWTAGERIRFVTDYAMRLFARQGERRVPLMQVIDEAGRFVPQVAGKGDIEIARCIGAVEQLVEWGRNVGVGVCLITQRSARMAKAVSELAECMVAFRTVGPRSIAAIVDWFGEHVPKARQHELVEQLRGLERGTALVVSPGWLSFEGTARIRARETFDSSATPKAGKVARAPGKATKPDLEVYRARMAETIERAEASDPKLLQRRVRELEQQVAGAQREAAPAAPEVLAAARAEGAEEATARLHALASQVDARSAALDQRLAELDAAMMAAAGEEQRTWSKLQTLLETARVEVRAPVDVELPTSRMLHRSAPAGTPGPRRANPAAERRESQGSPSPARATPSAGDLPRAQQAFLDAAAWWQAAGVRGPWTRVQLAFVAGYSPGSGSTKNALGALRSAGLVDYPDEGKVAPTLEGWARAAEIEQAATQEAIQEMVLAQIPKAPRAFLAAAIGHYPSDAPREVLAEEASYGATSGSTKNALGRLHTLGLVTYPARGRVRAADWLFLE